MNPLPHIGYHGENALIGIEYSLKPNEPIRILSTRYIQGNLIAKESLELATWEEVFAYLDTRPGMGIFLSLKDLECLESFLTPGEGNIPSRVMGVAVDKPEGFAFQKISTRNGLAVSLIRKTFLEEALAPVKSYQDRILGLNISDAPLAFFIPALASYQPTAGYRLELAEKQYYWQGGLNPEQAYTESIYPEEIARVLELPEAYIRLFAAMSLFYLKGISSFSGFPALHIQRNSLKKQQTLAKGLTIGIMCLSVILLLGILGNTFLSFSNKGKEAEIKLHGAVLSKIKSQEKSLAEKNNFLHKAGQKSLHPSKISFYLDRISALAGEQLRFDKLSYKPRESMLKKISLELLEKKPEILIQGYGSKSGALAGFSAKVQALDFIRSVEVFESHFSFEENIQRFTLIIQLKDD